LPLSKKINLKASGQIDWLGLLKNVTYLLLVQNPMGGKNLADGLSVGCIVLVCLIGASMQIVMVLQIYLEKWRQC
jgi:hypothetical protein